MEIGGYFGLECRDGRMYHSAAHRLNSGRSALRLIVKSCKIRRIHVPKFTCPVVWEAIKKEGGECCFYDVDSNFLPRADFSVDDYIVYTNYFGCCARHVRFLASKYPNIIIDNAQAFYMPNVGFASIYSPRKFFGIPDGGLFFCRRKVDLPERQSVSWGRCNHLLKRHDLGASMGYNDFKESDAAIRDEGVALMSHLTTAMMKSVDYGECAAIRVKNFSFLHRELREHNKLDISITNEDVPMVYPLLNECVGLREHLIRNKIYVATYWPGGDARPLTEIVPLPIDQRYGDAEMAYIVDVVKRYVR